MEQNPRNGRDAGLGERFTALLQRMGVESRFEDVYPELVEHYSESGRHYHNLEHIRQCLGVVDQVRELLEDPEAVELALWFHDVVNDPGAHDNELRSALMFDRQLGVYLPTPRADNIHAMIMATVHPSDARAHDEQFVADIDLSGMSLPWPKFLRDTESLRKERRHLSDSQFQLGTLEFFKKLLSRPSIYLTGHFKTKHGKDARRNILDLSTRLESGEDKARP